MTIPQNGKSKTEIFARPDLLFFVLQNREREILKQEEDWRSQAQLHLVKLIGVQPNPSFSYNPNSIFKIQCTSLRSIHWNDLW